MSDPQKSENLTTADQLNFIESMIQEGRKSTSYWGWCFVLWGFSYVAAMLWGAALVDSRSALWAWPVTMTISGLATFLISRWRNQGNPETTKSRAITSVWMAVGLGIGVFAFSSIVAHRLEDGHSYLAAIEILLGVAQLTSGLLLRWTLQICVGLGWWAAAVVSIFTQSTLGLLVPFVAATILLQIGFGIYLMVCEARDKARLRTGQVAHA